ncbi:Protein of unknown function [Microbacterium pygmaeum]|uniref:DUF559 domain-containing protein n=1 Tax=Microbacterium pygmaeum TaxID=370764 RepID=A0A1G8CV58_9MICO|nr:Protein of unknown function [Microbacterium pygmaeum]
MHRTIGVTACDPRTLIDPLENVLANVARCLDAADALTTWESAVRKGFVTVEHLRAVQWKSPMMRRLAVEVGMLSDSGLETYYVGRLRRIGIIVQQQAVVAGRRVDGLIGSRLVIQIDGFEHHSDRRQRRADIAHDRALRLLGYTVLRYSYEDVMFAWPRVEAEIRAAIAQGLHLLR